MKTLVFFAALVLSGAAYADELTLNDLPGILYKLRGCNESKGIFSGSSIVCRVPAEDLWAAVSSDGSLTLFRKRSYGDTMYARGRTVTELLRDFAGRINDDQTTNKAMLETLAPFLPTQ